MKEEEARFISVHTLTSRFEADLLTDALEQEEIPVLLRSFVETPYDGLFVTQRGWGLIMVPEDSAARAREVIGPLLQSLEKRKPYNDPSEIDPLLWQALREAAPEEICRNAGVRYDASIDTYFIPFLEAELACHPARECIECRTPSPYHRLDFELYLVTLHYLLDAQSLGLSGKWVSEKDIPGGELFFRGPHKLPTEPLLRLLGSDPSLFSQASEKIGGTRVPNTGDAAYRFWPFPQIPLLFIFWRGDEEFPADLHIRFDGSIHHRLRALDRVWALVNVVCRSLRSTAKTLVNLEK
jgi:hypothetical protein